MTETGGNSITWDYDDLYRLTDETRRNSSNAITAQTGFTYYDSGNRETRTVNGVTTNYQYNVLDQLTNAGSITYGYDDLNQLSQINYFDNQTVGFTYTLNGLRQTVTDSRGMTNYVYDNRDRLISISQPNQQEVQYTYDAAGNRLTLTTAAGTTRYGYDDAGRLNSVTDPALGLTSFAYDNLGLRTQKSLPNGVTTDYTYNALNRLTDINQHKSSTTLASYAYTLDPVGNRLSVTEANNSSIQWIYDDAYRLLSETRKDSSNVTTYQASFTYDPVGNRLSQTINNVTTNYTYNNLDQMLTAGATQYQYDDRGNLQRITNGSNITN